MTEKEILEKLRNDCENTAPDRFSDIRKLIENNNNTNAVSTITVKKKNSSFRLIAAAAAVFVFSVTAVIAANRTFKIEHDPEEYTHIAQAEITTPVNTEPGSGIFSDTLISSSGTVNTGSAGMPFTSDSITVSDTSADIYESAQPVTFQTSMPPVTTVNSAGLPAYPATNVNAVTSVYPVTTAATFPLTYPVTTAIAVTLPLTYPVTSGSEQPVTTAIAVTFPLTYPVTNAATFPLTYPVTTGSEQTDIIIYVYYGTYTEDEDPENIVVEDSMYRYTFFNADKCIMTVMLDGTVTDISLKEALYYFTPYQIMQSGMMYLKYEPLENIQ